MKKQEFSIRAKYIQEDAKDPYTDYVTKAEVVNRSELEQEEKCWKLFGARSYSI
jgi:hypothetical protein